MSIPSDKPKFQPSCFKPLNDPSTPAASQSPTAAIGASLSPNDQRLNNHHPLVRNVIVGISPKTPFQDQLQQVQPVQAVNPAPAQSAQGAASATPKPGQSQ